MKTLLVFPGWHIRQFIVIICTCITCCIFAQGNVSSDLTQEQFINGCARYRSLIIHDITDVLINFHRLCDSLKYVSEYPDSHEKLRKKMIEHLGITSDHEDQSDFDKILNTINEPKLFKVYKKWVNTNLVFMMEYSVLVGQNFIEENYPYKLTKNTDLWEEVKYYQLMDNMTLVDIGTGSGHFPLILAMSGYEGSLHMTEVDTFLITFLKKKLTRIDRNGFKSDVYLVKGGQKDALLGDIEADKIFFRETFHHLKHKNEMLESIKPNIKSGGSVYVKEVVRDYCSDKKTVAGRSLIRQRSFLHFGMRGMHLRMKRELATMRFSGFPYRKLSSLCSLMLY